MVSIIPDIFPVIFFIMFLLVVGLIIFAVVRGVQQWSRNNAQPRIPAPARVVAKRMAVGHHHNAGNMHHHVAHTRYYATFEFATGDRVELPVPAPEYGMLAEGDEGILTSQGTRFISFERRVG
jgi:hypothetical protein